MTFLAPAWLWAAAAVAVPLAIHLLSRGRGRVIEVGSVRFLPPARSHRLRRIRPSGLWRLLLRAALLASLAVALAAPRWWRPAEARPDERWQLIDPTLLVERERLEPTAPEIFERLDATPDAERRLMLSGLPRWNREAPPEALGVDLWSLAAEAAALAPPRAELEFFVLDRAEALRGARPDLGRRFEWWAVADPGRNRWIQRVVQTDQGLRATVGASTVEGTRFTARTLSGRDGSGDLGRETLDGREELYIVDGGARRDDDRTTIPPAAQPFRAVIAATPERDEDVASVRRATRAVAAHLGRPLVLTTTLDAADGVDLLVDLGDAGAAATVPAAVSLLEVTSNSTPCRQLTHLASLPDPWLKLYRCNLANGVPALWQNGWGAPLLSVDPIESGGSYRWHGRLDPTWSSLADSALPHLLLDLVAPHDDSANGSVDAASDRRAAVRGQGRPTSSATPAPVRPDRTPERLAWTLVLVLFVSDRLLVRRAS